MDYFFDRYIKFDVERILREYEEQKNVLSNLKAQLAELSEIRGEKYDGMPRGKRKSDPVSELATRRIKLENKIAIYQSGINTIERALKSLTEEEMAAVHLFFIDDMPGSYAVDRLCEKLNIERTTAYKIRDTAKEKIEKFIFA